ncbi:MAG: VCBS repeat-containing protein [Planctomycetes bacterium]|nr:VCBS repeat-containing protein [Planctomycetota bacterium]
MNAGLGQPRNRALAACAVLGTLCSCGFGSAGIAALSSGGSDSNSAPSLSLDVQGFTIELPKVPPAKIKLTLSDPESDPAKVELFYVEPSAPTTVVPMSAVGPNPRTLATSPGGTEHEISWDFTNEARLPADGSFVDGVKVIARVEGGASRELIFGLGNDAPVVADIIEPVTEVSGVVPIGFRVRDTSSDSIDVRAEFLVVSQPELGWRTARPASPSASSTPTFAFRGVEASRDGVEFSFFWDTAFDLGATEREVSVRFTAQDDVAQGAAVASTQFRVDNNEEPIVQIGDSFNVGPDRRRGIPIPYRVIDREGDPVRVLFQWRRATNEMFPVIQPFDPAEIERLLDDPEWLREKQVCTQFETHATGHLVAIDATHVRLPELAGRESWVVANGAESLELQIMRPRGMRSLGSSWKKNSLQRPVAAVPIGRGERALVLDSDGTGWSLREIGLASGASGPILAGSSGMPSAVAQRGRRLVVASGSGDGWTLTEVDPATGSSIARVDSLFLPGAPTGPIRGLVWLDEITCVATIGSGVWKVDWSDPTAPRCVVLANGLQQPWGVALDPSQHRTIWIAERAANRVARFDIGARLLFPGPALPNPSAITFEGNRILAVCGIDERELRGVTIGTATPPGLLATLDEPATWVACGPAGLRLVAHGDAGELSADRGVEQVRRVMSFDARTVTVESDVAFDPPLQPGRVWRLRARHSFVNPVRGSIEGRPSQFVWDSSDVEDASDVLLRAVCFDSELGTADETTGGGSIRHGLDVASESVSMVLPLATRFDVADLDGDGDLDLLGTSAVDGAATIQFQQSPRDFSEPITLSGPTSPTDIDVIDSDGDGDTDILIASDGLDGGLWLFVQQPDGTFSGSLVADSEPARDLVVADLDGDGDGDVIAVQDGAPVRIYSRMEPNAFARADLEMVDGAHTVAAADIDGDGDMDIIGAASLSAWVLFRESNGNLASAPVTIPRTGVVGDFRVARPADIDADGDLDVVLTQTFAGSQSSTGVLCLRQAPQESFEFVEIAPLDRLGIPVGLDIADLDGDGDVDILAGQTAQGVGSAVAILQASPGEFRRAEWSSANEGQSNYVRAVDLDGDGYVDTISTAGTSVAVRYQDAIGSFRAEVFAPASTGTETPTAVAIVDVDRDADLDLVTRFAGGIRIHYQTAPARFDATVTEPVSTSTPPHVVDLDGDGRQDVVYSDPLGLHVRYQTADDVFENATTIGAPGGVCCVVDLDADGDLDIVVGGESVRMLRQTVPRAFDDVELMPGSTSAIAAQDLDQDGDVDLAAIRVTDVTDVLVLEQQVDGGFVERQLAWHGLETSVRIDDLDGDGRFEILAEASLVGAGNGVAVFSRSESGEFLPQPTFLTTASGWGSGFEVLDIDHDGDKDITDGFRVLLQRDDGSFESASSPESFGVPLGVADIDGDGDPDLVFRWVDGGEIAWGGR